MRYSACCLRCPSIRALMGLWLRRAKALASLPSAIFPSCRSSSASGASIWAMSTRVSSVALRTPGFISSTKISSTNQAASAKISTSPHSSCSPILIPVLSVCIRAPDHMLAAGRSSCQFQTVAQPAMGQDQVGVSVTFPQLGANGLDVGVDGTIQALFRPAPHQIHQLLTRVDPSRCLHQRLEQQVLVTGEGQRLAVKADACPLLIQCQQLARLGGCRLAAAQYHSYPGTHLPWRERLGHIIVGANFQPYQPVYLLAAG